MRDIRIFSRRFVVNEQGVAELRLALLLLCVVAALALLLFLLVFAWPLSPYFLLSLVGWLLLRHRKNALMRATAGFLLPVAIGLGILLALLLAATLCTALFSAFNLEGALRVTENFFSTAADYAGRIKHSPTMLITAAALLVVYYIPQLRVMTRLAVLKGGFSRVALILAVITSYTFFTAGPVDHLVQDRYAQLHQKEKDAVGKTLAARAISEAAVQMDEPTKTYYKVLFHEIHEQGGEKTDEVVKDLVKKTAPAAADKAPVSAEEAEEPTGRLGDLDIRARASVRNSEQAMEGAKQAFSDVLGALSPEIKGILGEYVDALVEEAGNSLVEKVFKWTHATPAPDEVNKEVAREIKEAVPEKHPEPTETETR